VEKSPRTVAIVENDPSMRRSLERLLTAHGFHVEGYASAEAFLTRLSASAVDCALIDVDLGGMNGIELRRRLSASEPNLHVVFITAIDDERIEAEAVRAGCAAYLRKPFDVWHLIGAIEKVLAG
jgi:FixJ family two-component response regulator